MSSSNYYENRVSPEFISRILVKWDETRVLEAKVGDYLLMARRNGETWYIGGITNKNSKIFLVDLSFFDKDEMYELEWIKEGLNSDKVPRDYYRKFKKVDSKSKLSIHMKSGGGWIGNIKKQ